MNKKLIEIQVRYDGVFEGTPAKRGEKITVSEEYFKSMNKAMYRTEFVEEKEEVVEPKKELKDDFKLEDLEEAIKSEDTTPFEIIKKRAGWMAVVVEGEEVFKSRDPKEIDKYTKELNNG